jgi:hypothetical protein
MSFANWPKPLRKGRSIVDVLREAAVKGLDEDQAVVFCRATIHIPKFSDRELRTTYQRLRNHENDTR